MNITEYINLWLSVAKLDLQGAIFDKTIHLLTKLPQVSKVFTLKDLAFNEMVAIVTVMSKLKIKDKNFLELLILQL